MMPHNTTYSIFVSFMTTDMQKRTIKTDVLVCHQLLSLVFARLCLNKPFMTTWEKQILAS